MPYIEQKDRDDIDPIIEPILNTSLSSGELNYVITRLCQQYLANHKPNYSTMNNIVGILECAKQEFYRRIAAPYEDLKITINGDVK